MKKFFTFILCFCMIIGTTVCFSGCSLFDDLYDEFEKQIGEEFIVYSVEIVGDKDFVINSEFDENQFTLLVTFTNETTEELTLDDVQIVDYPKMDTLGTSKMVINFFNENFELFINIVESK